MKEQVLAFFGQLPPCVVAMEACGCAHFWGREIGKLGHEVRLIPSKTVPWVLMADTHRNIETIGLSVRTFVGYRDDIGGNSVAHRASRLLESLMA